MIHCTPVAESERSFCRVGIAIATIVWSMKVIETAKIIAARISLLFLPPVSSMNVAFDASLRTPPRLRPSVFSPPSCLPSSGSASVSPAFVFLVGVISGARSRTASVKTGAAMGAYLGVMLAFPLLAIGFATS